MIEPRWVLVFCRKRGRWWVRLLAWGRYHHVRAFAYLPSLRAWLFYDMKFHGTRLLLAHEDGPDTQAFLYDYLDDCDLIAMPRLPTPKRVAPHPGFWCTLAIKHLVGIRTAALRPERLWWDCITAGGKPYADLLTNRPDAAAIPSAANPVCILPSNEAVTTMAKAHALADATPRTVRARRAERNPGGWLRRLGLASMPYRRVAE